MINRFKVIFQVGGYSLELTNEIDPQFVQKVTRDKATREISDLNILIKVPPNMSDIMTTDFPVLYGAVTLYLDNEVLTTSKISSIRQLGKKSDRIFEISILEDALPEMILSFPDASMVIRDDTLPGGTFVTASIENSELTYPVIFGQPGVNFDPDYITIPAVPIPLVIEPDETLVGLGTQSLTHIVTAYSSSLMSWNTDYIDIFREESPSIGVRVSQLEDPGGGVNGLMGEKEDLQGNAIVTFTPDPIASSFYDDVGVDGQKLFAALFGIYKQKDGNYSAGLPGSVRDVLLFMASRDPDIFDLSNVDTATEGLDNILLDFYIDERVSPLKWILDNVMPLVEGTLTLIETNQKVRFFRNVKKPKLVTQVISELIDGQNFTVISEPVKKQSNTINQLIVNHSYNAVSDNYTFRYESSISDDKIPRIRSVMLSQDRYGVIPKEISTNLIYRHDTLDWVVYNYLTNKTQVSFDIEIIPHRSLYPKMLLGQWMSIISEDYGWNKLLAQITSKTDKSTHMEVTLSVLIEE